MVEAEALAREFLQQLFDGMTFIEFLVPRAARRTVFRFLDNRGVALFFYRKSQVQIRMLLAELRQRLTREKIVNRFLVAFPNFDQVLRQYMGLEIPMVQIDREVPPFAPESISVFVQRLKQLENLAQLLL